MKNATVKILLVAQSTLTVIYAVLLVFLMTGALEAADFMNGLAYILLPILFAISFGASLYLIIALFSSGALKSVLIHSDATHETKMPASELKRMVKNELANIEGAQFKRAEFLLNENGLTLYCVINAEGESLEPILDKIRESLSAMFKKRLDLFFYAIDIKVKKFKFEFGQSEEKNAAKISPEPSENIITESEPEPNRIITQKTEPAPAPEPAPEPKQYEPVDSKSEFEPSESFDYSTNSYTPSGEPEKEFTDIE